MSKRFSVWDDDPEDLPIKFAGSEDMEVPWGDIVWLFVAVAVVFLAGVFVGGWVV